MNGDINSDFRVNLLDLNIALHNNSTVEDIINSWNEYYTLKNTLKITN